jgi:hypothetical protein
MYLPVINPGNIHTHLPIDSQRVLKNLVFGYVMTMVLKNISKVQRIGQRTTGSLLVLGLVSV